MFEGKLIMDPEVQFDENEPTWNYILDISPLWQQYQSGIITLSSFNEQYMNFLLSQEQLKQYPEWLDLMEKIKNLSHVTEEAQATSIYNTIYDFADKNLIEIKTT
jgi:hypothetical protein